jgi:hypothetical protein
MERGSEGIKEKRILSNQTGSRIIVENGRGVWTAVPRKNELGRDCYYKSLLIVA